MSEKDKSFKRDLSKIATYAGILWAICVLGVIGMIALASKIMTHDPDFSPGDPENRYLLPMLAFFFIGLISFIVMAFAAMPSRFIRRNGASYRGPLGITLGKVLLLVAIVFFGTFSFLFGVRQANVGNYAQEIGSVVTGQEVFEAVSRYRQEQGLSSLSLEPRVCDNLVQRYLDIVNPDNKYVGHAGFERWANNEGLVKDFELAEVYVNGIRSGAEAVKYWETSPGHRSALIGNYNLGCAYANQGIAVVILGKRK